MRSFVLAVFVVMASITAQPVQVSTQSSIPSRCGQARVNSAAPSADQTSHAIVGGTRVANGDFPWVVSICLQDWLGSCSFQSAGVIISETMIFTSYSALDFPKNSKNVRIHAGSVNHTSAVEIFTLRSYFSYIDVNEQNHFDDIAAIMLQVPIKFNDNVQPICITADDTFGNRVNISSAMFAGWGRASGNPTAPIESTLRKAELNLVDGSICQNQYKQDFFPDKQICAGGSGSATTCTYDVGGPLMTQYNGLWYLLGISATKNYDSCDGASVFMRASAYCDFMEENNDARCVKSFA